MKSLRAVAGASQSNEAAVLPKLIHKFSAVSFQILIEYFIDLNNCMLVREQTDRISKKSSEDPTLY